MEENEIEIDGIKYHVEFIKENDSSDKKEDITYKAIIIGSTGVGRSTISLSFYLFLLENIYFT